MLGAPVGVNMSVVQPDIDITQVVSFVQSRRIAAGACSSSRTCYTDCGLRTFLGWDVTAIVACASRSAHRYITDRLRCPIPSLPIHSSSTVLTHIHPPSTAFTRIHIHGPLSDLARPAIMTAVIPSPPAVPFLGHVNTLDREVPIRSLDLLARQYGEIFELNILGPPKLFFLCSDTITHFYVTFQELRESLSIRTLCRTKCPTRSASGRRSPARCWKSTMPHQAMVYSPYAIRRPVFLLRRLHDVSVQAHNEQPNWHIARTYPASLSASHDH